MKERNGERKENRLKFDGAAEKSNIEENEISRKEETSLILILPSPHLKVDHLFMGSNGYPKRLAKVYKKTSSFEQRCV